MCRPSGRISSLDGRWSACCTIGSSLLLGLTVGRSCWSRELDVDLAADPALQGFAVDMHACGDVLDREALGFE